MTDSQLRFEPNGYVATTYRNLKELQAKRKEEFLDERSGGDEKKRAALKKVYEDIERDVDEYWNEKMFGNVPPGTAVKPGGFIQWIK